MIIIAEKMVAGGSCLAKIDGKAVFVPGLLPGERADIEIIRDKKDYAFARVLELIEASEHRITAECPLFGRCGGCSLQMADYGYQLELKKKMLEDIFQRAGVKTAEPIEVVSGDPFGYRSRFQFHRMTAGVGLKESDSDTPVMLADCPIAARPIREGLKDGTIAKRAAERNSETRFHVFSDGDALWQEDADEDCEVTLCGRKIGFDVRGFFQSNLPVFQKLACRLNEDFCRWGTPEDGSFLDFYAGVGTFSVLLSDHFSSCTLVEHNKRALHQAKKNLEPYSGKSQFCSCSDDAWPSRAESRKQYDSALIDPPRQGMSKTALQWFASSKIPVLRYVSCDPVTLARDASRLQEAGYRLIETTLYDFYPHTAHMEACGIFIR